MWQKRIIAQSLVEREKIILPPVQIKLGIMKQFVKAINTDGPYFVYM